MDKRFFNYAEALKYFGAKRKWFDKHIRPNVDWTQAGQCKVVDRVDLDRAWDEYQARREGRANNTSPEEPQCQEEHQASTKRKAASGKSTSGSDILDFNKAFERVTRRKPGSHSAPPSSRAASRSLESVTPSGKPAAHYLNLYPRKLSIQQEAVWLQELMPFVGDLPLDRVYDGTLADFVKAQRAKPLKGGKIGVKSKTINLKLGLVRHILRLASRSWRSDEGETWLPAAPLITMVEGGDEREPRQLTWQEQQDKLHELPWHLYRMALFDLQCGARDDAVCNLRWSWEVKIPELDIITFIVPAEHVKGQRGKKKPRAIVCNTLAREIIDSCRGEHPEFVFTYSHNASRAELGTLRPEGYRAKPPESVQTMNNTAWQKWRERCGLGDYDEEGKFHGMHVHDLRHTVGMRLREAGVPEDTRADVLWHTRGSMTRHYSAGTVKATYDALELITDERFAHNKSLATIAREAAR